MSFSKILNILMISIFALFCATCAHDFDERVLKKPEAQQMTIIPLVFHTRAYEDSMEERERIFEWLMFVQESFEDTNIRFYIKDIIPDSPKITEKEKRIKITEIDLDQSVINIYIVDVVINNNKKISGLHHHKTHGHFCNDFISISFSPNDHTLAHELGHVFGLNHVPDKGSNQHNIMFSGERNSPQIFVEEQKTKMERVAKRRSLVCYGG